MSDDGSLTFWDHLVLRSSIIRMIVAAVVMGIAAFFMKDWLFNIVLAPKDSSFCTYRLLGVEPFSIQLVNTGLTEQFMIHMKVALMAGILVASPYIIYTLFRFISPALYENERRYSVRITVTAYIMFLIGVVVNYLLIFPLTVRFLGTYQVSKEVVTMLTITSYIDTLLMMSLVFRRHAIVAILIVAAIITPTADVLTLIIVSLPIWLLYEVSILLVRSVTH